MWRPLQLDGQRRPLRRTSELKAKKETGERIQSRSLHTEGLASVRAGSGCSRNRETAGVGGSRMGPGESRGQELGHSVRPAPAAHSGTGRDFGFCCRGMAAMGGF